MSVTVIAQLLKKHNFRPRKAFKNEAGNIIKTENKKLWTWQERFNAEVKEVEALLKK